MLSSTTDEKEINMLRRGFRESFQMGILNLEQAHDQLLFFQKQASYAKPAYFFILSHSTSIKPASRRYTAQVEADGIMKFLTFWRSHTHGPRAYGVFHRKNIWISTMVSQMKNHIPRTECIHMKLTDEV